MLTLRPRAARPHRYTQPRGRGYDFGRIRPWESPCYGPAVLISSGDQGFCPHKAWVWVSNMVGVVRMGRKKSRGGDASPSQLGSPVEFGREVRRRREAAGMTLEDLAESSELSPNYIGQIETGKRDPSLATMESLAEALDV